MKHTVISQVKTDLELSNKDCKEITIKYLQEVVLKGDEHYVTHDGNLEHWTSFPHGSGTTTELGKASKLQCLAYDMLQELKK